MPHADQNELSDPGLAPAFHGYAPVDVRANQFRPPLSVTISRDTGSRGGSIAKRAAELLGWQLVDQETLDYAAHHPAFEDGFEQPLTPEAEAWVEGRVRELAKTVLSERSSESAAMVRTLLEIGAQGEAVILGRGAVYVLPPASRLSVRLVAPESERVAYIAQIERLSLDEAEKYVRQRDRARRRYLTREFGATPGRGRHFDLVLDSSGLGVEGCAALISAAVREKEAFLRQKSGR